MGGVCGTNRTEDVVVSSTTKPVKLDSSRQHRPTLVTDIAELRLHTRSCLQNILQKLESEPSSTLYDLAQVFPRYASRLESDRFISGDPNAQPAPFPSDQRPENLRPWVQYGPHMVFGKPMETSQHVVFHSYWWFTGDFHWEKTLRSMKGPTGLDCSLEGEAAWSVLPVGVVARDVGYDEHLIRRRKRLAHLLTREAMLERRREIVWYFMDTYGYSEEYMSPYLGFSERMERNQREFLKLL